MAMLIRFKPASFVLLIVPRRYFCGGSFCFMSWCLSFFLCCWRLMYVFIFLVKVTEWPPIGKIFSCSFGLRYVFMV